MLVEKRSDIGYSVHLTVYRRSQLKWQDYFEDIVNETYFHQFKRQAETLGVTVLRAENQEDAAGMINDQINGLGIRSIAAVPLKLLGEHVTTVGKYAAEKGVDFTMALDRQKIEFAQMGVSEFEMGIAQLGTIFQDASDLHTRLVSMLPPVHLVLLPANALVKSFADALTLIHEVYGAMVPPYLTFVTGPSKTADIERQLTIGVHGPAKLIIICIEGCYGNKDRDADKS